jgi:hypothetical protein
LTGIPKHIKESNVKYNSYSSEWHRDYFNHDNGGCLLIAKQRIKQSKASKQEKKKYDKEYDMCLTLAKNGYRVEYLKQTEGSFDIYLNDIGADLKKTKTHNNMVRYAKKAIREQGAEIVIFEFEEMTHNIIKELYNIQKLGIWVKYFTTEKKVVLNLSEIQRPE